MIIGFFTGVIVAIPTSLVAMKLLNSSLFIDNQELRHINEKVSILINQLDDYREVRLTEKMEELAEKARIELGDNLKGRKGKGIRLYKN